MTVNYVTAHNAQLRQYHHSADTPSEREAGEHPCSPGPAEVEAPRYGPVELPDGSLLFKVGPGGTIMETLLPPSPPRAGYLETDPEGYRSLARFCQSLADVLEAADDILTYEDPDADDPDADAWQAALQEARGLRWAVGQLSYPHLDCFLIGGVSGFLEDIHREELELGGRRIEAARALLNAADEPTTVARNEEVSV